MSCPDCFAGHIHHGHTAGTEIELHGLKAYVTEPPEGAQPKGLIVVVPDAFGWQMPNTRLVADVYAKRTGCRVYIPEFMQGE
jgi:dienelactone hydrolase